MLKHAFPILYLSGKSVGFRKRPGGPPPPPPSPTPPPPPPFWPGGPEPQKQRFTKVVFVGFVAGYTVLYGYLEGFIACYTFF